MCVITSCQSFRCIPGQMGPVCVHASLLYIRVSCCSSPKSIAHGCYSSFPYLTKPLNPGVTQTGFGETTGQRVVWNQMIFILCSGVGGLDFFLRVRKGCEMLKLSDRPLGKSSPCQVQQLSSKVYQSSKQILRHFLALSDTEFSSSLLQIY